MVVWFFSNWFETAFNGLLWPILGFLFAPTVLLWYSVVVNVYDDDGGAPGKLRGSIPTEVRMKDDSYAWHKVRLPEPLRFAGKARFWLGTLHQSEQLGLAYNADSVSKEARFRRKGTGLGLYIVKTLVHLLKGKISVSDRPGAPGSVFEVQLPGRAA